VRPDRSLDLVSLARSKHWAISERVPQEITPAARRVLDRLTEVPTCLCDAAENVLAGNRRWLAFNCGAATADGRDRDMPWRTFTSAPSTVSAPPGHAARFRAAVVAELRAAARRYPADPELRDYVRRQRLLMSRSSFAIATSRAAVDPISMHESNACGTTGTSGPRLSVHTLLPSVASA
jgi:hypothetical protein